MIIGICDDVKAEAENVKKCISEKVRLKGADEVRLFSPEEIKIEIEDNSFPCDVMILDIDFQGMNYNGIDIGKMINQEAPLCQIIYLTNILDFAPDVYETNHCYFVLKNNMSVMLSQAIKKAVKIYEEGKKHEFIEVISDSHKKFIPLRDIIYIERMDRKTVIVTRDRKYGTGLALSAYRSKLSDAFVRCYSGDIINLEYVEFLGKDSVDMKNGVTIPIGKTYAEKVRNAYLTYWSNRV